MKISKQPKPGHALIAILGTALTVGLTPPTFAKGLVGPDIAVHYSAYAIDKEQGAAGLLARIESAARRICSPLDRGDVASRANATACASKVTAHAVHTVNHPMLLAMYNSKHGITTPVASLVR